MWPFPMVYIQYVLYQNLNGRFFLYSLLPVCIHCQLGPKFSKVGLLLIIFIHNQLLHNADPIIFASHITTPPPQQLHCHNYQGNVMYV